MLTGLDPAETGKVTTALDQRGVGYKLENNGTALAVDKSKVAQARIALAEQGLPGRGTPGFELFDKQKLGTSDFQQKVTYQRALEGEIARTIEGVQGVSGARVQLVLPEDQLFADNQSPARAAVLLSGDASGLDPGAVRGIASLVTSSVKGLKSGDVSITDGTGQLLWPRGGDSAGGATSKQAAEDRYNRDLEGNLNQLLIQTLGPGKAQVQVKADLNVDQSTRDELLYAKKGTPIHQEKSTEQLGGGGAGGAKGAAGAGGNIPSYVQAGGGGGAGQNYQQKTDKTDFGVSKTVTRTKVAPGQVNKLDVAVLVDKSVPAAAVSSLKSTLASAAGVDSQRGDSLAISQVAFAKVPTKAPSASPVAGILGYAKYALLGLALVAFLFFVSRHLRKRENEALGGQPTWLREIEGHTPIAALGGQPGAAAAAPALNAPARPQGTRAAVEEFATREPERIAQQVRAWMNEDA
jgi:flagellar M-ring protein FliF